MSKERTHLRLDADVSGSMRGLEPPREEMEVTWPYYPNWLFERPWSIPNPFELSEEEMKVIREALVTKPLPEWIKKSVEDVKRERTS